MLVSTCALTACCKHLHMHCLYTEAIMCLEERTKQCKSSLLLGLLSKALHHHLLEQVSSQPFVKTCSWQHGHSCSQRHLPFLPLTQFPPVLLFILFPVSASPQQEICPSSLETFNIFPVYKLCLWHSLYASLTPAFKVKKKVLEVNFPSSISIKPFKMPLFKRAQANQTFQSSHNDNRDSSVFLAKTWL